MRAIALGDETSNNPDGEEGNDNDYGYEDAVPDSAHQNDNDNDNDSDRDSDPYGYEGDATDLGYGDAVPDSEQYGYGDAVPDSNQYGYGDATPDSATIDYGYGDARPDTETDTIDKDLLGYGDATPDSANPSEYYGYNDEVGKDVRYNDETEDGMQPDNHHIDGGRRRRRFPQKARTRSRSDDNISVATAESYGEYPSSEGSEVEGGGDTTREGGAGSGASSGSGSGSGGLPPRRTRYRRRGSVTKYSLDTAETVKRQYDEQTAMIQQFRSMGVTPPTPLSSSEGFPSPQDFPNATGFPIPKQEISMTDNIVDESATEADHDDHDGDTEAANTEKKKKKKKKGLIRRFTMR